MNHITTDTSHHHITTKFDLSYFDPGMIVGARWGGLSISVTAISWDFHAQQSQVYSEWYKKQKTSSEQQFCGQKRAVDERGQRRRARLYKAERKMTVTNSK